jgi:hypothetical protein
LELSEKHDQTVSGAVSKAWAAVVALASFKRLLDGVPGTFAVDR